ncbi:MAG: acetyl-CoA acetyltransferase [Acidimicrobiia bacterium]|nr:acetyl-CoA acetyltransferase [Acidimicrobiia bacterium]
MSTGVSVVGASLSDTGRVDTRTPYELHFQAASRALADAGLTRDDVDGLASTGTGLLAPVEMAEYLGLRPTWADGTGVGGSTWEFMLEHAVEAVQAGHARVVLLVYGSTTRADLKARRRRSNLSFGARGPVQFDAPYGLTLIAKYAMAAQRHMYEYGTTIDQLAEIAVAQRYNASLNPEAFYRDLITVEDVAASRMIAEPLTKLHCCMRSDGGGAVVVTSDERADDLPKPPVRVLGTGETTSHTAMSEWEDFTVSPAARSGALAFERAGVTPDDIDICEFYDAFTPMVLLTLEALGFCGRGEGGAFVEGGRLRVDGDLPTNTDGGGLSACHPGMRGIFLIVEAVRQLRGEAGDRQVDGARLACVNGTGGWFSSTATAILATRDYG